MKNGSSLLLPVSVSSIVNEVEIPWQGSDSMKEICKERMGVVEINSIQLKKMYIYKTEYCDHQIWKKLFLQSPGYDYIDKAAYNQSHLLTLGDIIS